MLSSASCFGTYVVRTQGSLAKDGLATPVARRLRGIVLILFFFQAEDGIRDYKVTGVQTCALPISAGGGAAEAGASGSCCFVPPGILSVPRGSFASTAGGARPSAVASCPGNFARTSVLSCAIPIPITRMSDTGELDPGL